jgi:hypothetical protein
MSRWPTIITISLFATCHASSWGAPKREQVVGARSAAISPVEAPSRRLGGMYGRGSTNVWQEVAGRDRAFTSASADGRSQARARRILARPGSEEEPVVLDLSGAIGRHHLRLVPGVGTELLWAPGGSALMVTTSGGGLNGIYDLILVDRLRSETRERNISDLIRRRFGHPVPCDYPEPPNVAGIAWLPNGNMLVAAEIVHHSNCDSYGTFAAYEVAPAGPLIVRAYDQIEAKRRFGPLLGWEIADAPDHCVIHPSECRVADGYGGE